MYPLTSEVFGEVGTACLWLKPSYHPEMTGKPRTHFSADTLGGPGGRLR